MRPLDLNVTDQSVVYLELECNVYLITIVIVIDESMHISFEESLGLNFEIVYYNFKVVDVQKKHLHGGNVVQIEGIVDSLLWVDHKDALPVDIEIGMVLDLQGNVGLAIVQIEENFSWCAVDHLQDILHGLLQLGDVLDVQIEGISLEEFGVVVSVSVDGKEGTNEIAM